jgi:hypothetical protein
MVTKNLLMLSEYRDIKKWKFLYSSELTPDKWKTNDYTYLSLVCNTPVMFSCNYLLTNEKVTTMHWDLIT